MAEVFPDLEGTRVLGAITKSLEDRRPRTVVNEYELPDGKEVLYELKINPVDEGVLVFSSNVSQPDSIPFYLRERMERLSREVRQNEEKLRKVLDASLAGVQQFKPVRSPTGEIIDFEYVISNRVACEIVGKPEEELIGRHLLEVLPGHKNILPEYGKSLFELYREVVETGQSKSLFFRFEADGIAGWFSNKSVRLGDGFVVMFNVVTELIEKTRELERLNESLAEEVRRGVEEIRQKDQALIQQAKLAAMGDMISAVAHQWRQPLEAISLGLQVMEDIYGDSSQQIREEDRRDFLKALETAGERVLYLSETIEDFRSFYSPSAKKEFFDLGKLLQTAVNFFSGQLSSANIRCQIGPELWGIQVYGNANQFRQVILNLVNNSIEAFPNRSGDKYIRFDLERSDHRETVLTVRDNAGGITEEVLPRIFEPYFSTKGPASGCGIGLFISKLIIEKSFGGIIQADNRGEGLKISLKLPHVQTTPE